MKPLCRKRARFLLAIVVLGTAAGGYAQPPPVPQPATAEPVMVAIDHLRNLEYEAAKEQFHLWLGQHPGDLQAWNYLGITILYEEMFRCGVLESKIYGEGGEAFKPSKVPVTPEFQQGLFSVLDQVQRVSDERLKQNPADQEALYWSGVGHGTRATYHFALRKEYKQALHEATDAYNRHRDLLKLDPGYVDAYLVVGMNNYIVGSLPWYIKLMAALTGRHGDRAEGLRQVRRVSEQGHYARDDARLMLAVLYQRETMYGDALRLYQQMADSFPRNYLLVQEVAALRGLNQDWSGAAEAYDFILDRHRSTQPGFNDVPVAKILHLAGQAYERAGKPELALARYSEGATLTPENRFTYLCELGAAGLEAGSDRTAEARRRYQRVAGATPNSEEGKLALRALKNLPKDD